MATGDLITRDNVRGSTDWDASQDYSFKNGNTTNSIYWIAAPVITVQLYTNASGLNSNTGNIHILKWNGTGTDFTAIAGGNTKGGFGASNNTWRFVHNCNESCNAYDNGNIHLFKIIVHTTGNGTKKLSVRAGNVRSTHCNNTNIYARGTRLRCCRPDYWASGNTYSSDAEFVNGENPGAWTSKRITATLSNYTYGEY